jgi:RNA polymerase sigma factor (sigma-70 family)
LSSTVSRDGHVALLRAAQGGDRQAIGQLLAACQPDARRYARLHCAADDVDDAVQEAMLTLSRKVGAIRALAAFTSWLFVVIKRECLRLARRVLPAVPLDDTVAEQALQARSDTDLRLDLLAALESLPPHYREVILLRDMEELTSAEIAARLGESPAAIKSRLHRAREMVREFLVGAPCTERQQTGT